MQDSASKSSFRFPDPTAFHKPSELTGNGYLTTSEDRTGPLTQDRRIRSESLFDERRDFYPQSFHDTRNLNTSTFLDYRYTNRLFESGAGPYTSLSSGNLYHDHSKK